jgi:mannosyltransferase
MVPGTDSEPPSAGCALPASGWHHYSLRVPPVATAPNALVPAPTPVAIDHEPRETGQSRRGPTTWGGLAVAVVVAGGLLLRFWTRSDLWFDEALSVDLARLPLGELRAALAHDGHPPLYYVLLHVWMSAFGDSDLAVRSLSGLFAIAALPLAWRLGERIGGRSAGFAAFVVLVSSPFAIRYATEARMYTLVMLLVLGGALALRSALESGRARSLVVVGLASGCLLLTHYWSFYLVGATGLLLSWLAWRAPTAARRRRALGALGAVAAGGLLFVPWIPTFWAQAASTGTPWGLPARPAELATTSLTDFGGGDFGEARLLGALTALCVLVALFAQSADGRRLVVDLRTRPRIRAEAGVVALTLALASLGSWLTSSATATRYLSVLFPIHIALTGVGVAVFASRSVRAIVLSVLVALGAVGGIRNIGFERTQGGEIAAAINAAGADGDLVAFCPDQLGPATVRHLEERFRTVTFPDFGRPELVDWRDYAQRQRHAEPAAFADGLLARAGTSTIWLAWAGGHRTHGRLCETTAAALRAERPATTVVVDHGDYEHGWLFRYDPR